MLSALSTAAIVTGGAIVTFFFFYGVVAFIDMVLAFRTQLRPSVVAA